eukprot:CAMPEP_0117663856 /NCGR_PEP_ID=MMETSP0804-20121206/8853_1 /TAXON_ID=1074897 /ORGANISM="Tetraselmis astigmatica, Strain CCMP880" /LENGTH=69 /DNA_ID=CAMNT_0005470937 /DNA_START=144 /DNA_END=353 /DNA_ORIENTATION=-
MVATHLGSGVCATLTPLGLNSSARTCAMSQKFITLADVMNRSPEQPRAVVAATWAQATSAMSTRPTVGD